jgi:hypothetical protein
MSFDLGVWHSDGPLTNEEAGDIYLRLCEDWPHLEGDSADVIAFYEELIGHWPEIDSIPEENVGNFDICPWSCALDHSGEAVVMACVWSKADEVFAFVSQLADKHKLVLFDPQANQVSLPDHLIPKLPDRPKPIKKAGLFRRLFGGPGV